MTGLSLAGCAMSSGSDALGRATAACSSLNSAVSDLTSPPYDNTSAFHTDLLAAQVRMRSAANMDRTYSQLAGGLDVIVNRAQQDGWNVIPDAAEDTVLDNMTYTECPKYGLGNNTGN